MMRLSSTFLAASLALAACSTAERGRDSAPTAPTIIQVQPPSPSPLPAQQSTTQRSPTRDGTSSQSSELQPCIPPEAPPNRTNAHGSASPAQPPAPQPALPPTGPTDVRQNGSQIDTTHGPAPRMPSIPDAGASPM